jgi:hypothetical protein
MANGRETDLIRFVVDARHPPYGNRSGIFTVAYDIFRERELPNSQHSELEQLLEWFRNHLAIPKKFTASKHPRAEAVGISWIRASAHQHITHLRQLVALLREAGIQIEELRTHRPGYVLYEDDYQVVALPFSDTPS